MRLVHPLFWLALGLAVATLPCSADAQVICISNANPPPELPAYEQPPMPAPGFIWIPGYWAGGPYGYFWVPGTWVEPPAVGLLWTPGYWAWRDGIYVWNAGYWGPHIGFYGGINYGFGYVGVGYEGGRWENGVFVYNRAVNNLAGLAITNVYEKIVVVDPTASRVSFNGGNGGTTARPTKEEEAAAREQHLAAVPAQLHHERTASADRALLASENHGRPAIAATAKPNEFSGRGVVAARGALADIPSGARPPDATALRPTSAKPRTLEEKRSSSGKVEATGRDSSGWHPPATNNSRPETTAGPPTASPISANEKKKAAAKGDAVHNNASEPKPPNGISPNLGSKGANGVPQPGAPPKPAKLNPASPNVSASHPKATGKGQKPPPG